MRPKLDVASTSHAGWVDNKNEENKAYDIYYLDTQTAKVLALPLGNIS